MRLSKAISALCCAFAVGSSGTAFAQDKPIGVVELFTSQGCNSCPPVDTHFNALAAQGDVIALAYHVDYWDYLGWRDTLAKPQNTERQYAYMKALGSRDVYTPQVIVNGGEQVKHPDLHAIRQDLVDEASRGEGMTVPLTIEKRNESVIINVGDSPKPVEANLVLVYFDGPRSIAIDRGENTGRTATYVNAVTDFRVAGMWHGKANSFELPKTEFEGKGGCVALLQSVAKDGGPGPILGATVVRKP